MSDLPATATAGSLDDHPLLGQLTAALEEGSIDLPPLPAVAAEVSSLLGDADVGAAALAELIQSDPGLAGEIIRVSNSAAYAPRTPIVSLQQAISWLGITEIEQIVYAICVHGEVFTAPGYEDEIERLWHESLAAGLWCKELARLKRRNVETAYLGGLLHRVGRAAVIRVLSTIERDRGERVQPVVFAAVADACEGRFGEALGLKWQLPSAVLDAVCHWQAPAGEASLDATQTQLAHLLALETFGAPEAGDAAETPTEILDALNIYVDDLTELRARTDHIRQKATIL